MKRPKRLVLWDIDGTLILGGHGGSRALRHYFLENYGWDFSTESLAVAGLTDQQIVRNIFHRFEYGPTQAEINGVLSAYTTALENDSAALAASRMLLGVPGILHPPKECGECFQGLLTGNTQSAARIKLQNHDLWKYFPFGAFGDEASERKDLVPIAWEKASLYCGYQFTPKETWIVGDTPRDYLAGKAHSTRVALVSSNPIVNEKDLEECQADLYLNSLADYDAFWSAIWR